MRKRDKTVNVRMLTAQAAGRTTAATPTTTPPKVCTYCGKPEEFNTDSTACGPPTLQRLPGGTYWDHCDAGRRAGVEEIIRLDKVQRAQHFADSHLVYDEHRPCPKCGNEHRTTEFNRGGVGGPWDQSPFPHPYIKRHCGRCTFTSYEVPLDFDPEKIYPKPAAPLPPLPPFPPAYAA